MAGQSLSVGTVAIWHTRASEGAELEKPQGRDRRSSTQAEGVVAVGNPAAQVPKPDTGWYVNYSSPRQFVFLQPRLVPKSITRAGSRIVME